LRRSENLSGCDTSSIAQNGSAARGTSPQSNTRRAHGSLRG
jgi:hypothetical protein